MSLNETKIAPTAGEIVISVGCHRATIRYKLRRRDRYGSGRNFDPGFDMKIYRLLASAAVATVMTAASSSHAATYTEIKEQYVEVEHAELAPYIAGDNYGYDPSAIVSSSGAYFYRFRGHEPV